MSRYRVSWHAHLDECAAAQVEALVAGLAHATLFNTLPWCEAAATALPASRALHVLQVADAGGLAAWLPLTVGRERIHGLPLRTLRLLGHPFNDRVALPLRSADPALACVVVDALLACPCRWDVLVLSEMHDASERRQLDAALAARAIGADWRACSSTPVLALPPSRPGPQLPLVAGAAGAVGAANTAKAADNGKAASRRAARARRKLAAAGSVRFERLLPTPDQVPRLVALCKAIEDRSWKGAHGQGIFSHPDAERFFRDAGARLAARAWLDIGLLYADEQPVSYRFGFRHRGAFLDFNLAFDPAFSAFAPGRILLDDMIASSQAQGLVAVDASRSSRVEPHLLAEWSDARIEHHELWVFAPTPRGRLLGWARRSVRPLLHRLRVRGGRDLADTTGIITTTATTTTAKDASACASA